MNILGVLLVLPFTNYFARLIKKILPSDSVYLYHLNKSLLQKESKLALISTQQAVQKIFEASLVYMNQSFTHDSQKNLSLQQLQKSIDEVQEYIDDIILTEQKEREWEQLISLLHALNHLERFIDRCETIEKNRELLNKSVELLNISHIQREENLAILELFAKNDFNKASKISLKSRKLIYRELDKLRDKIILKSAKDHIDNYTALEILDSVKWFKRINKHIEKFTFYYEKALQESLSKVL